MTTAHHHSGWVIIMSFILALILSITPMPGWTASLRPEWVVLVLAYWCMALPDRVGIATAWGVGLLLDVLKGALLGQHAMSLSVIAFLTLKLHQRVRVFPLWQQALIVLLLTALHQLIILWIKGISGQPSQTWIYWLPSLSSMVLWPLLFVLLRHVRRYYRVS
jgi:rod shape-determining protein MreD